MAKPAQARADAAPRQPRKPAEPRGTNASGRETRELLIATAERLFAEQGIDAVSLRRIGVAAGMRMTGGVAYHFSDKAGLIRAIVDHRSARLDQRVQRLLEELEREHRLGDLRAVTEATIRPAVEQIQLGTTGHYYRFLAQLDRHPGAISDLVTEVAFRAGAGRVIELQDDVARGHLPAALVEHRRRVVTHMVLAGLANLEEQAVHGVDEALVSDLIGCVVAVYTSPAPTP
jgi:AcrR family transcriptional regulator